MSIRRKADDGPEPNIPITPMLDMAFQLLAFFVMTYHPSDLEGQMQLALPSNEAKSAHNQKDVDPATKNDKNPVLEIPSDLTVVVKTQIDGINNGAISALTVEDRSGPATIRPANPEQPLTEALTRYLQRIKDSVDNKAPVKLQADSRLKWDNVVQVMDACRKAGFENISFAPPPDYLLTSQ
jgi:biopolymer transport protein ExbD